MFNEWNWHPSPQFIEGAKKAWHDSQMDSNESTGTQAELAQFQLRIWSFLVSRQF